MVMDFFQTMSISLRRRVLYYKDIEKYLNFKAKIFIFFFTNNHYMAKETIS